MATGCVDSIFKTQCAIPYDIIEIENYVILNRRFSFAHFSISFAHFDSFICARFCISFAHFFHTFFIWGGRGYTVDAGA